jgi:predicted lactoylglutathione lyase
VNAKFSDEQATSVMFSDAIGVMVMTHDRYRQFTQRPIGDARRGRADPNPEQDHGFMFSRSVEDPDGNVCEIMWMDAAAHAQVHKSA